MCVCVCVCMCVCNLTLSLSKNVCCWCDHFQEKAHKQVKPTRNSSFSRTWLLLGMHEMSEFEQNILWHPSSRQVKTLCHECHNYVVTQVEKGLNHISCTGLLRGFQVSFLQVLGHDLLSGDPPLSRIQLLPSFSSCVQPSYSQSYVSVTVILQWCWHTKQNPHCEQHAHKWRSVFCFLRPATWACQCRGSCATCCWVAESCWWRCLRCRSRKWGHCSWWRNARGPFSEWWRTTSARPRPTPQHSASGSITERE